MPYAKLDLQTLYSLSPEEVEQTLATANLSLDSETYTDEEIQLGFDVIRSYFNSGQVSDYTAAAKLFSQQQRTSQELETQLQAVSKQPRKSKKSNNSNGDGAVEDKQRDISELLSIASEKCGTRIKLSEATDILATCALPDQEQYSQSECDRFLEACDLIKNQGKTPQEVAAQFGVLAVAQTDESQDATSLIQEVNELLSQASFIQMEQIREMLPQLAVEQLQEIKAMFWRMTAQRLRQHVESGELEAEIRKASSSILNGSGNSFGLLSQLGSSSRNLRSLPGSSTNASISE